MRRSLRKFISICLISSFIIQCINFSDASNLTLKKVYAAKLITTSEDNEPPTAPENLTVIEKTGTSITLNWTPSKDNIGVDEYDIYDGTSLIGFTKGSNTYTINNLSSLIPDRFIVRAKDKAGNVSQPSNLSEDFNQVISKMNDMPTNTRLSKTLYSLTSYNNGLVFNDTVYVNGIQTDYITNGSSVQINVSVTNNNNSAKDVTPILGLFEQDNNKMINYTLNSQVVAANSSMMISVSMQIPNDDLVYELRLFKWDSLVDMNPLAETRTFISMPAKPQWYTFNTTDENGTNMQVYMSDIGGDCGEKKNVIARVKEDNQTLWNEYILTDSGNDTLAWVDTGSMYAYAPGQGSGIATARLNIVSFGSFSIKSIQDAINNKKNELLNKLYDKIDIEPVTPNDISMIFQGIAWGIDDNVFLGFVQWVRHIATPDSNYYYVRAKAFTDAVFTSAYTVGAAGSAAAALQALQNSGIAGTMALAASPTVGGGVAFGAASVEELSRAAAMTGVSFISAKMATRSQKILQQDVNKLSNTNMLGKNGTQFTSKTVWEDGSGRVDCENPAPGKRPARIHYQYSGDKTSWKFEPSDKKFYYDTKEQRGVLAPPQIQKLLDRSDIKNALNKALQYLNEPKAF